MPAAAQNSFSWAARLVSKSLGLGWGLLYSSGLVAAMSGIPAPDKAEVVSSPAKMECCRQRVGLHVFSFLSPLKYTCKMLERGF